MKFLKLSKKNVELLISSLIVNLAVAYIFVMRSDSNKLTVFADSLLIISLIHLAIGAININRLHGDFDGIAYFFSKGGQYTQSQESKEDFDTFVARRAENRDEKANIPLYSGIIGALISIVVIYLIVL